LGNRGIRWADVDGKRRLLVGGTINSYVANPTFDPVAKPGSLYEWYRGNPRRHQIVEAFGELEPLRPEYQDREQRLKIMNEQGLVGVLLFPTIGVGIEDALKHDPEACIKVFHGFNRWLEEDWGFNYKGRIFAAPYIAMLDPVAAVDELQQALDAGAIVVNIRDGPVPVAGGYRSPLAPISARFRRTTSTPCPPTPASTGCSWDPTGRTPKAPASPPTSSRNRCPTSPIPTSGRSPEKTRSNCSASRTTDLPGGSTAVAGRPRHLVFTAPRLSPGGNRCVLTSAFAAASRAASSSRWRSAFRPSRRSRAAQSPPPGRQRSTRTR